MFKRLAYSLLTVAALVSATVSGPARAEDATPSATACTREARSADDLVAIWLDPNGTPIATPTPEIAPDAATLAGAPPVDANTQSAIDATVHGLVACANSGEFFRQLAYWSDRLVATSGPEPGTTEREIRDFIASTPEPITADQVAQAATIVSIGDAVTLSDGRVVARVEVIDPTIQPSNRSELLFFVQDNGRWLVDGFLDVTSEATPAATPGA